VRKNLSRGRTPASACPLSFSSRGSRAWRKHGGGALGVLSGPFIRICPSKPRTWDSLFYSRWAPSFLWLDPFDLPDPLQRGIRSPVIERNAARCVIPSALPPPVPVRRPEQLNHVGYTSSASATSNKLSAHKLPYGCASIKISLVNSPFLIRVRGAFLLRRPPLEVRPCHRLRRWPNGEKPLALGFGH
jgi:hypothetical protein